MKTEPTPLRFGSRRLGDLQHDVMAILWEQDGWLTPRHVWEAIERDLAYTTVMTVLTRLEEQDILERRRQGRAFEYRATMSHDEFYADRLADVLDESGDKAATLARFVEHLTVSQRHELAERLNATGPNEDIRRGS